MSTQRREEYIEQRQEERQRDREHQEDQQLLQQAFNQQGNLSRGWMQEILNTDDLEDKLQESTIKKIQSMLNKQWFLANLTDAETHDRVYKLDVIKLKILGEHPPQESSITGDARAFIYDDEWERLEPLTPLERNSIDQVITTMKNAVTRSRDGFERKQINTNIARTESESAKQTEDSKGTLTGLFS